MTQHIFQILSSHFLQNQGCHSSAKSQGNLYFFKVRELSGKFANCQGNMELLVNVRESKIPDSSRVIK